MIVDACANPPSLQHLVEGLEYIDRTLRQSGFCSHASWCTNMQSKYIIESWDAKWNSLWFSSWSQRVCQNLQGRGRPEWWDMMRLCEIITIQYLALKYIIIPIYRNAEDRLEWLCIWDQWTTGTCCFTPGLQGSQTSTQAKTSTFVRKKNIYAPFTLQDYSRLDSFIETNTS